MAAPADFWQHDYDAALESARALRKFVLLDVFNPG
jgi:hypothetical protein